MYYYDRYNWFYNWFIMTYFLLIESSFVRLTKDQCLQISMLTDTSRSLRKIMSQSDNGLFSVRPLI